MPTVGPEISKASFAKAARGVHSSPAIISLVAECNNRPHRKMVAHRNIMVYPFDTTPMIGHFTSHQGLFRFIVTVIVTCISFCDTETNMARRIGYARVSTDDQNLSIQKAALEADKCGIVFEEKKAGPNAPVGRSWT